MGTTLTTTRKPSRISFSASYGASGPWKAKRSRPSSSSTLDSLTERQAQVRTELASLNRRRQRAWEIGEAGGVSPGEVKLRLEQISADRDRYETELARLETEIRQAATAKAQEHAIDGILRDLERTWASAPLDCQQEAARALGEIVGGFWLAPGRRGRGRRRIDSTLETGLDSPSVDAAVSYMLENMREVDTLRNVDMAQRKMDDSITKKFIQTITE